MHGLSNFEFKYIHEHAKSVCYRQIKLVRLLNRIVKANNDISFDYQRDLKKLNCYNKFINTDASTLIYETKKEIETELSKIIQNYKTARYGFIASQLDNGSYDLMSFCEYYFDQKGDVELLIKENKDDL